MRRNRRLRERDESLTDDRREIIMSALNEFNNTYTDLRLIEIEWNSNNFIDEEHLEVEVLGIPDVLEIEFWGDLIHHYGETVILRAPLLVDGESVGITLEAVFDRSGWRNLGVTWK